ncbi:hypothetical protein [Enterobacter ludwigii]|uniref:hypothetical protein n=1 Tax=Enterobacter ludwigii TaxID=299767 RepID=UPI003F6F65D9
MMNPCLHDALFWQQEQPVTIFFLHVIVTRFEDDEEADEFTERFNRAVRNNRLTEEDRHRLL